MLVQAVSKVYVFGVVLHSPEKRTQAVNEAAPFQKVHKGFILVH